MGIVVCDIGVCFICGMVDICDFCIICFDFVCDQVMFVVVEDVVDFWVLECVVVVKVCYYVLGGILLLLDGVGLDDFNVIVLIDCCLVGDICEVILVISVMVEGQIMVYYIMDQFFGFDVQVMWFVYGVFVGGEFDYFDEGMLVQVLKVWMQF